MRMLRRAGFLALVLACCPLGLARAGWGVYVGGAPYGYGPYYRPYWGVRVGVFPSYPVYGAPPPAVVVQPGQVYVAPPPPPPARVAVPEPPTRQDQIDTYIDQLQSPRDDLRVDALLQLGRLDARRACGRMIRVLRDDPSPQVREAAARGLALIDAPFTLTALQRAALADPDPNVRGSARYAIDVIRTNRRNP